MRSVLLGDIAEVFNGRTPSKAEKRDSGHPVLKVRDLTARGAFVGSFDSFVDDDLADRYRGKWARVGDTVILNAAHNVSHVASKAALLRSSVEGALITGEWLVVRPKENVDARFLHYWLSSPAVRTHLKDAVKGIHLYPRDVASLKVSLPPLDKQHQIAATLDQADSLRIRHRQVLDHLDDLNQSIFHDMFDAVAAESTVGEIAVAEKGSVRTGPFGSQLLHSEFVEEGVAVLGLDNVVENEFRWAERRFITSEKYERLRRYTVRPGDVLISIMGTTGRCVVVPDNIPTAINTKHICAITPNRDLIQPEFLRAVFLWHPESRMHLRRQAKGSIMAGLNMGIIKSMPVPAPPMDVQIRFGALVHTIRRRIETVREVMNRDDELFASLQSHAFRGEL